MLNLLEGDIDVFDVRNDEDEKDDEAVVLEYEVSTDRSLGAGGKLLPREVMCEKSCQPAAGDLCRSY